MTARIAVFASGGGTNLQAILDHFDAQGEWRAGDVVLVVSDRDKAGALQRAEARGVPTAVVQARAATGGRSIDDLLDEHRIDLIALAGYLRLVPERTVEAYRGRIVNVHPALLPSFGGAGMYGARVHQAVLDSGATVSGATVHFVDQAYDRGPVIAQWPVPVFRHDTAPALAQRVLHVEHVLYPLALDAVVSGRISLGPAGVVRRPAAEPAASTTTSDAEWAFCLSPSPGPRLAIAIARALGT